MELPMAVRSPLKKMGKVEKNKMSRGIAKVNGKDKPVRKVERGRVPKKAEQAAPPPVPPSVKREKVAAKEARSVAPEVKEEPVHGARGMVGAGYPHGVPRDHYGVPDVQRVPDAQRGDKVYGYGVAPPCSCMNCVTYDPYGMVPQPHMARAGRPQYVPGNESLRDAQWGPNGEPVPWAIGAGQAAARNFGARGDLTSAPAGPLRMPALSLDLFGNRISVIITSNPQQEPARSMPGYEMVQSAVDVQHEASADVPSVGMKPFNPGEQRAPIMSAVQ